MHFFLDVEKNFLHTLKCDDKPENAKFIGKFNYTRQAISEANARGFFYPTPCSCCPDK